MMENCKCIKDERINNIELKLEKHEKRIADIESDKKLQTFQYEQIMKTLNEMNTDIKEMKEKPSKRWDIIITSALTGIVAYFVSKYLK